MFRDPESVLKQFVQMAACGPEFGSCRIRFLHLTENLGFTKDHRVKSACHPEEMPHTAWGIVIVERCINAGAFVEVRLKRAKRAHRAQARRVKLHPIAGGKDNGSGQPIDLPNSAQRLLDPTCADRKLSRGSRAGRSGD